jgi:hypothetical protein
MLEFRKIREFFSTIVKHESGRILKITAIWTKIPCNRKNKLKCFDLLW